MGMITACCGMVCKSTKIRNMKSFVRDLKRANEYAARAETKIGRKVAGMVTSREWNMAVLSG